VTTRRLVWAVLAACGLAALPAASAETYPNIEIYRVVPGAKGAIVLAANPRLDTSPSPSPDGRRIAFVSSRAGSPDVYVMNASGGAVTRATTSPFDDETVAWNDEGRTTIAWSPDGKRFAFDVQNATYAPDCAHLCVVRSIYVANVDGTGLHRIADQPALPRGRRTASYSPTRTRCRRTATARVSESPVLMGRLSGRSSVTTATPRSRRRGRRAARSSCTRRTERSTRRGPTGPVGTGFLPARTRAGRRTARSRSCAKAASTGSGERGRGSAALPRGSGPPTSLPGRRTPARSHFWTGRRGAGSFSWRSPGRLPRADRRVSASSRGRLSTPTPSGLAAERRSSSRSGRADACPTCERPVCYSVR
jgi:WD40-like Beta Propeller Repeat